ncbi:MAG: SDR family oxidoreductase [Pseudomonadota bacterium]|nr:SDR family oxidoreductase [Pseudomonadota bacterium]
MTDKCAVVTGSSSGIGRAVCELLLKADYKVLGIARDHSKFTPNDTNYFPFEVDLKNQNETTNVAKALLKAHPEANILISNAGEGRFNPIENFSTSQIKDFLDLNLISHILLSQIFVRHLKARSGGNIIFLGSEAGLTGKRKATLYSTAKFGLRGFSQALSDEVRASNIRVSLINPGLVRTPFFNGLGFRPGDEKTHAIEAEDVAEVIMTVLSSRSQTILDEINMSPAKNVIKFDS